MASGKATLKLYNTLTRAKGEFTPLDPANVRMYVCGPTVYDFAHIGNARPVIVFDVLFRLLRHLYGAEHVTYVRNITDVDDKINARAARDYPDLPLNEAIRKVTETTNAQFQADVKALGCLEPTVQPRATEHIAEMIAMITTLVDKGHAYPADGHVLFDVKSFRSNGEVEYGKLSRRSLDEMLAGARVEVAPYKRDPMDFVLWKPSTPEEPGWDSPWGRGRPGWHIECSAMSEKHLGEVFDIHGGGIDLAFPHHENELAQSRCAHDTAMMAQVWMHNGFLQVEGRKMAKSEGNFVTISDLLNTDKFGGRKWPGEVLRLAMLMTHYREPIDFSVARLEEARNLLSGFWSHPEFMEGNDEAVECSVLDALSDDLNTPRAIAALHQLYKVGDFRSLGPTLRALGFAKDPFAADVADVQAVDAAIAARLAALNAKDFATADRIRAELLEQGIQLKDAKNEAGERVTTWEVKR
ncbi:cysteine--tRNA ligase [Devosia sp.]|uniref:cysteine--tRNA ligase n=1 Tax=Devosia sp. TaxID=1871048 RepID=UPI002EF778DE